MADSTIEGLPTIASVDRATDKLAIWDASASLTGEATISSTLGITGDPVGTSDSQTLTNKILTAPTVTVRDNALTVQDNADNTKQFQFQASGITAGQTRIYTLPDYNATVATLAGTETLTNKTLTSPTINTATIANPTLTVDTISEFTSANGVNVDGLLIKDGLLPAGNIQPLNLVSGTGSSWAWSSYVVGWTASTSNPTLGNGTLTGRYIQTGKQVIAHIVLTFGSTTAVGSGSYRFSLPVAASSNHAINSSLMISGLILDTSAPEYAFISGGKLITTTTTEILSGKSGSFAIAQNAFPFTWATGDYVDFYIAYEAA